MNKKKIFKSYVTEKKRKKNLFKIKKIIKN